MRELLDFIDKCTDSWHTADTVADILSKKGYTQMFEGDEWDLTPGGKYYIMRNMSSIIAFKLPDAGIKSFMITAAHGESPSFKLKPNPEKSDKSYTRLGVEAYGGMILSSWLDRPLSVSGRALIDTGVGLKSRLVKFDRDMLIIPSLAPHLSRDKDLNILRDMMPMYALTDTSFTEELSRLLAVEYEKIKGFDLMLYNRERGRIWGANKEFISAPRLDDLQCVYAIVRGFEESEKSEAVQVCCILDNEEVGSGTKQGAKSDFLPSVIRRICDGFSLTYSDYMRTLSSSFMVSADNAHAVHPNRRDMSDSDNYPEIGKGVVIKYNASQRYTTDAVSEAIFKKICEKANVPYQVYANRSDIAGGSTLGNLAAEKLCINTVDVGLPQLAMHSAYETAGTDDTRHMISAVKEFYKSCINLQGNEYVIEN